MAAIAAKPIEVNGKLYESRTAAAIAHNLDPVTFIARLHRGETPEEAAGINRNKRNRKRGDTVHAGGLTFSSHRAAADYFNVTMGSYNSRRARGWTIEEALGLEEREKRKTVYKGKIKVDGQEFPSLAAAARAYNVSRQTMHVRLSYGWTLEESLKGRG